MTATNTVTDPSAPATDGSDTINISKPPKKPQKVTSEAYKKSEESLVPAVTRKSTRKCAPASTLTITATRDAPAEQPRKTKASAVEALLTREGGASLAALCEATAWQPHTCRAFLTGLRKKGREVIRASDKEGMSIYLIATERSTASSPVTNQTEAESN